MKTMKERVWKKSLNVEISIYVILYNLLQVVMRFLIELQKGYHFGKQKMWFFSYIIMIKNREIPVHCVAKNAHIYIIAGEKQIA